MQLRRNRSTFSAAIAPLLAGAVAAGLTLLTPSDAEAGLALGADLALPVPVDNIAGAGTGMTLEGRLGWQFGLMIFDITPELKGGYSRISTPGGGAGVARGLAGGRLGLGGPFQPGVFVHLGYGSMIEYLQRACGYAPSTAFERMRVAEALEALPAMRGALAAGEVSFSAVKALSRVATPDDEGAWLAAIQHCTVREIEDATRGHHPGDGPDAAPDPAIETRTLKLELTPDAYALFRETRRALAP